MVTSIERACSGIEAFELTPTRLIGLPTERPRVLAIETDAPAALLELHRRLATRLARSPRPDAADRFVPHVTLARLTGGGSMHAEDVALPAFDVREVVLCRSVLTASGAEHSKLASVTLR